MRALPCLAFVAFVAFVALTSGCAHRTVAIGSAELERVALDVHHRGAAEVHATDGERIVLDRDEKVVTRSGEMRAGAWIGHSCEPSGACHFEPSGVTVSRVDTGRSLGRGLTIGGGGLVIGAAVAGVACGTGAICASDDARTVGAVTLGAVGGALAVGVVALATCKSCWAVAR